PDGWVGFAGASILVTYEQSASGQWSCFVGNRSESYMGIEQNLLGKMVDGGTYDISAWFLLSNSSSEPTALTIKQTDATGTNYHTFAMGTATDTAWSETNGTFTLDVTGTLSGLSLFTEGPAPGVELYVDHLSLTATGVPACGNGTCAAGENCTNCAADCPGVQSGPPSKRYCCGNGVQETAEGNGSICDGNY
ncbi:MAG TPA: carbohydrate binding domain-containing protein, partial [Vicinamibacterales bacterium]